MKSGWRPENIRQLHTSMQALMKIYNLVFSGGINLGELGHGNTQCILSVEIQESQTLLQFNSIGPIRLVHWKF